MVPSTALETCYGSTSDSSSASKGSDDEIVTLVEQRSTPQATESSPVRGTALIACALFLLFCLSGATLYTRKDNNTFPSAAPSAAIDSFPSEMKTDDTVSSALSDVPVLDPTGNTPITTDVGTIDKHSIAQAFSILDPVNDLKLHPVHRPDGSSPGRVFASLQGDVGVTNRSLPTNSWYENLLLLNDAQTEPSPNNLVYTVPYALDMSGPISGIRVFVTRVLAMATIVQITYVDFQGLTLGAAPLLSSSADSLSSSVQVARRFSLDDRHAGNEETRASKSPLTPLGLALKWEPTEESSFKLMSSSIVRGMPYVTMHYHYDQLTTNCTISDISPTVASQIPLFSPPIVDGHRVLSCKNENTNADGDELLVVQNVELTFGKSDFTWLVFYSLPVVVRCYEVDDDLLSKFQLQVVRLGDVQTSLERTHDNTLTARVALLNNCTRGQAPGYCEYGRPRDQSVYGEVLKKHAHIYPGPNSNVNYKFLSEQNKEGESYAFLNFHWDARYMSKSLSGNSSDDDAELIMYSLPHHLDSIEPSSTSTNSPLFDGKKICTPSLNGKSCLVTGDNWVLREDLNNGPNFYAPRPPLDVAIQSISRSLKHDIKFTMPEYFTKGIGDTYFSGKMLAKFARILLIANEMKSICSPEESAIKYEPEDVDEAIARKESLLVQSESYTRHKKVSGSMPPECSGSTFPSQEEMVDAIARLRSNVEIWINGSAAVPFVYDMKWGGLVSCGCWFNERTQRCDNEFPNCPCFEDPGLDFGHGFYNDHHFHQGYHIYAAAALAKFDPEWGRTHFENVLLLIRDIANPSPADKFFPVYRHKDWYLGNSWAAGISIVYPNGRNQESSSEAIAAYEAIALFGSVMDEAWGSGESDDNLHNEKAKISRHIREVGRLLTSTEVRSADRYWHVRQNGVDKIYPDQYQEHAVGIMWNLMAQFQTWFGAAPFLAYGIQLMPLTPAAEQRDNVDWVKELYPTFASTCEPSQVCHDQGWGVLQYAMLATVGHPLNAIAYADSLADEVFESAGGNGHSRTNTLWFYSTRKEVEPLPLVIEEPTSPPVAGGGSIVCECPDTCTPIVWNSKTTGEYSCGDRIEWLMQFDGKSEHDACGQIGGVEFPHICAGCDPNRCISPSVAPPNVKNECKPCSIEVCQSPLNRCSVLDAPFLCEDGANKGGCSQIPWDVHSGNSCTKCCELSFGCGDV